MKAKLYQEILDGAPSARIVVIGDFAIDFYYEIDGEPESELVSVETGDIISQATGVRFEAGGAANVCVNIVSLGAGRVEAIGWVGTDRFAPVLKGVLADQGVETGNLVSGDGLVTPVYTKVMKDGEETMRIDLGSVQKPSKADIERMIELVRHRVPEADGIIVNQQIAQGCMTDPGFITPLGEILQEAARRIPVVVDSRDISDLFSGAIRKLNQAEAYRIVSSEDTPVPRDAEWNPSATATLARLLRERWSSPVVITRGKYGAVVADTPREGATNGSSVDPEVGPSDRGSSDAPSDIAAIEGIRRSGPTDTVGAGDSFLAGMTVALSGRRSLADAARLGTIAAAVTVTKLHRTGTATPEEVFKVATEGDYLYHPEAIAPSLGDRTFEIISPFDPPMPRYVIFDHDGTISTLREGWEAVMRRHMFRSIVGDPPRCRPERQTEIRREIDTFIEETTGVQTIIQMHGLVDMVRRFGLIPEEEIQDPPAYKADYTADLRRGVDLRLSHLQVGLRSIEDFTMKGVLPFLDELKRRGVTLFLASGTDQPDTIKEAQALGYADLFTEIHGSVDDISNDPKALVLSRLLDDIPAKERSRVCVIGDGPVEMREGRKRGCVTIGVISDEVRRYGWNNSKRQRLVTAGASILIPDFADWVSIVALLWGESKHEA